VSFPNEYPFDNSIKMSAEECDLHNRRAAGEDIPIHVIQAVKYRTIQAHWIAQNATPPHELVLQIRKWLGAESKF